MMHSNQSIEQKNTESTNSYNVTLPLLESTHKAIYEMTRGIAAGPYSKRCSNLVIRYEVISRAINADTGQLIRTV